MLPDLSNSAGTLAGALRVLWHAGTMRRAQAWINVMNSGTFRAWADLAILRRHWDGPIVLKGVQTVEDARAAATAGMDGIVVSNHGGRQLNGALATLDALPDVVAAVQGRIPVHVDGGIRHGTDVFKALALGARFVFVGRPFLCAAAVRGEPGVRHAITLLWEELQRNMAMLGITEPSQIGREHLLRLRGGG